MIGIDLTYFDSCGIRQGGLNQGVDIFLAELLDGLVKLDLQSHFCLIVDYDCVEFVRKRFPDSVIFRLMNSFVPTSIVSISSASTETIFVFAGLRSDKSPLSDE